MLKRGINMTSSIDSRDWTHKYLTRIIGCTYVTITERSHDVAVRLSLIHVGFVPWRIKNKLLLERKLGVGRNEPGSQQGLSE